RQPMIDEGDMAADGHSGAPHERELAQLAVVEAEGHPGARFRHRHGELAVRDLLFGAHLELTVAAANAPVPPALQYSLNQLCRQELLARLGVRTELDRLAGPQSRQVVGGEAIIQLDRA